MLFLGLLTLRDLETVPEIDENLGLDEDRLSRPRGVVDNPLDLVLVRSLDRQNVALRADREVTLLKVRRDVGRFQEVAELVVDRVLDAPNPLPKGAEFPRGVVRELPIRLEAAGDIVGEPAQIHDRRREGVQQRGHLSVGVEVLPDR